jgi:hypothetical protein
MRIFAIIDTKGGETMCCNTGSRQGFLRHGKQNACMFGCDAPEFYRPRFITNEQQIANLDKYMKLLQDETKAVKERIAQAKKQK